MSVRLFHVFGDFSDHWPRFRIAPTPGLSVPDQATIDAWLAEVNNLVTLEDLRFGAAANGVAAEAKLLVAGAPSPPQFVLSAMPDVLFRVLPLPTADVAARLVVSQADGGVEVVIEGLAVEIELPVGMVMPPAAAGGAPAADVERGTFTPGILDSRRVVLRESQGTLIRVHVRVVVDRDLDVVVLPQVPLSFGSCRFLGIPCQTAHDLTLIPEPKKARTYLEWLRHDVDRWFEGVAGDVVGAFAVRSLQIDTSQPPLSDAANYLNPRTDRHPAAAFVLEDLVLPFFSEMYLPVPRHLTTGIQRRVVDPNSLDHLLSFDRAPVNFKAVASPAIGLLVNHLHYKSVDIDDLDEDQPASFEAAVYVGDRDSSRNAMGITLEQEYTVLATYLRSVDDAGAGTGILDWTLANVHMSVAAVRAGVSIGRLADGQDFAESFVFAADIAFRGNPLGTAKVRLEGMSGEPVNFVLERVGWWFGPSVKGAALPEGVQVVLDAGWEWRLIIIEAGLLAHDNGGHYLFFSGGLRVTIPSGWEGGFTFRRLRVRVGGNEDAPRFGIDGFFILLAGPTFHLEVGGYYREERIGADRVEELGLSGSIGFSLAAKRWTFALDLIIGSVSGSRNFDYLLFMGQIQGSIPLGVLELTSVRFLYADDMRPRLVPGDSAYGGLRFYQWHRRTDPTTVSGDRRLDAWEPTAEAWAIGVGAGASFPFMGEIFDARLFVLGVSEPGGGGLMIAGEARIFHNPNPVGYFVIEWDGGDDRFSVLIGVDVRAEQFVSNPPSWLNDLIRLTGSLLIRTNPATVAIGRLNDPLTWLRYTFDIDLWLARSFLEIGFCFEYVDDPNAQQGMAFTIRAAGASWFGPGRVEYHVGFGFYSASLETGSGAFALAVWIEGGLRFALFGFLNFGLHARADFRAVGQSPAYETLGLEVRIETPWFLPDVTFRLDETWGSLEPEGLATVVSPLTSSSSLSEASQETTGLYLFPAGILAQGGNGQPPVQSIEEIRNLVDPGRLGRVAAWQAEIQAGRAGTPVATDAAVQLAFGVPITDLAGVGTPPPAPLGGQRMGDLELTYEVIGFAVRRRRRFDPSAPWRDLAMREEIMVTPDGSGGVTVTGSFDPLPLTAFWEPSVIGGQPSGTRLLLNGTTPFTFVTSDPEADEQLLEANPSWPCCHDDDKRDPGIVELVFTPYPLGDPLPTSVAFPGTVSRLHATRPADVLVSSYAGTVLPSGRHVMSQAASPGNTLRAVLEEPATWISARPGWPGQEVPGRLVLIGLATGEEVAREVLPLGGARAPADVLLTATKALTEIRAWIEWDEGTEEHVEELRGVVEFDRFRYLPHRVAAQQEIVRYLCGDPAEQGLAGNGKLALLPNHEYELELRTRVRVKHPQATEETAGYTQYAYLRTKGLPGLNAVERVGAEVEPYVDSEYPGRGDLVYRAEPVTIAFGEGFNVIVPVAERPNGPASDEREVLLQLALAVRPDIAADPGTAATATGPDWIVDNRREPAITLPGIWQYVAHAGRVITRQAFSVDARRIRLAAIVQRPHAPCAVPDPRLARSGVLVHDPIGGGTGMGGRPLWPARTAYIGTVVVANSPFVHRERFEAADRTSFDIATEGGTAVWGVDPDGFLTHSGNGRSFAIFGESSWDHVRVTATLDVGGAAAGIAMSLPGGAGTPARALLAAVERSGPAFAIVIRRRSQAGGALAEVARAPIPSPAGPVPFVVTVFDDVVRAEVGDVHADAPRENHRAGRLALFADGAATFQSLDVASLTLFETGFATSRYERFEDHVASFTGDLDRVSPDDLGVNAASATVPSLYAATVGEIGAAMAPGAAAPARHALFERWAKDLALPLRESVEALSITRYEVAGHLDALLLESPEPLRFSAEVSVAASRLERARPTWPFPLPLPDLEFTVLDDDHVQVDLPAALAGRELAVVAAVKPRFEWRTTFHIYRGVAVLLGRRRARLVAEASEIVTPAGPRPRFPRLAFPDDRPFGQLLDLPVGGIALIDEARRDILGIALPTVIASRPVPLLVLTDGPERRALFVALSSGAPASFAAGRHRFEFRMSRERFASTTPDALSRYDAQATLEVDL